MPGEALRATTSLEPLAAALVVSTAYREGVPWCPVTITGSRAALPLIDNTVLAVTEPARPVRLAGMLAPSVVMLQGSVQTPSSWLRGCSSSSTISSMAGRHPSQGVLSS